MNIYNNKNMVTLEKLVELRANQTVTKWRHARKQNRQEFMSNLYRIRISIASFEICTCNPYHNLQ